MLKRNRLKVLLTVMVLTALSLACGLGNLPGLGSGEEATSTPIAAESETGAGSTTDGRDATTIGESTSSEDASEESPEAAEPAAESDTSESAAETTEDTAEEEAPQRPATTGELAEDQIFILPGGEPPTMDPHLSGDATSAEYVVEVFSGLMAYDIDLNLVPDIAESYEISEDGLVYTFKIRDEATFQDGKPIQTGDFKWSFERACDPATGSRTADTYLGDIVGCRAKLQGEADEVEGVRVIDDQTLELTIDEPKGFFLAKMTYPTAYVLDQENVESGGDDWFHEPNGSGPFILEEYAPEEGVIILAKNENFYGEPKPTLERVIYLINAPVDLMNGYESGLGPIGLEGITYDTIPVGTSNLSAVTDPNNPLSDEFVSTPELSVFYIGFNINQPPFDDPLVRQAFNLALDKQRMVRLVFQGLVEPANGIVPPTMPGYENPDLSAFEFDPEQALALIAESSYEDVSELPEITLNVSGEGGGVDALTEAMVESFKQNLGVEISVEQAPWPEFLADLSSTPMPYQMYQLGWVADYPDPQNFLEILFHTESSQNYGGYSNPEVDTLLDQARQTQDLEERLAIYQQVEQLLLEDAAWIPLYFSVDAALVKPYVQGYVNPPIKIPKFQYVSIAEH